MSDPGGEPSPYEGCYVHTRTTALPSAGRRAIWFIVSECVTGPPRIRLKASVKSFGFFPSRGRKASDASRRRRRLVVVRPTPYGVGLGRAEQEVEGRKDSDASRWRRRLVVVRPTPYGVGLGRAEQEVEGRKASDASRWRRRLVVVRPTPYGVGLLRELAGMDAAMGYCTRTHSIVFDMMPEPATISKPVAVSLIVIGTN